MARCGYHVRLDLHGLRAETAAARVESLIYTQPGIRLEIVHGYGHGILRDTVRRILQECPCVERIVCGETENLPGAGGVTVAYTYEA